MAERGEPEAPDPAWPRYSRIPFPPYRFVPGLNPHPRSDPRGHSYGAPEKRPAPWRPEEWRTLEPYLYGIDLYNFAYWWECHETLEGLWHAAGRTSVHARFVHGLILVSAAHLNRFLGRREAALRQVEDGLARMESAPGAGGTYMGLNVLSFCRRVRSAFADPADPVVLVRLESIEPVSENRVQ